jgi:hypothetical protein
VDIKARDEAALTRADEARRGLDRVQDDIDATVLSGVEVPNPLRPSKRGSLRGAGWRDVSVQGAGIVGAVGRGAVLRPRATVATLVSKLAVNRFLAVIGPSGSGKSSFWLPLG